MRRLLLWIGIALGALAVWRHFRRRPADAPEPSQEPSPAPPAPADPAEELRQRLAETRGDEPATDDDTPSGGTIDERRNRVHQQAQEAIDRMQGATPGD